MLHTEDPIHRGPYAPNSTVELGFNRTHSVSPWTPGSGRRPFAALPDFLNAIIAWLER